MEIVQVVVLSALPIPSATEPDAPAGAFVNVYTTEQSESIARAIALREVAAAGWQPGEVEEQFWLARADLAETDEGLAHFEQTLQDGLVLVFHTYTSEQPGGGALY